MNWESKLLGTPFALNPDVANNDKFLMDRERKTLDIGVLTRKHLICASDIPVYFCGTWHGLNKI